MADVWVERVDEDGGEIRYEIKCGGDLIATVHEPGLDMDDKGGGRWNPKQIADACAGMITLLLAEVKGGRRG